MPVQITLPEGEYAARIAAVREKMAECRADALIVDCVEHMAYLFGYAPPAAFYQPAVLPLEGDPIVVVRSLDLPMFSEQSWVRDCVVVDDWGDPVAVLAETIEKRGFGKGSVAVEFDSHFMPVGRFRQLQAHLPTVRFADFSTVIRTLRLYKSDYEIACLREASRIADIAMTAAIETAGAGVPERDCAAAYYSAALKAGADNGRNLLMASGKRSGAVHGRLGSQLLQAGDIMHVEAVPLYRGYGARSMRPTVIGAPTSRQQQVADRLIALQDAQFAAMRPGAAARDIDRIVRDGVLKAKLRSDYTNVTGYTLGYIGLPVTSDFTRTLGPNADWALENRMVFHVYTWAEGMAFSDTILVTENGAEALTRCKRRLFVQ